VGRFLELIPLTFLLAGGLWEMIGITEITPVVCIVYDTIKHRHLHPAFALGWSWTFVVPAGIYGNWRHSYVAQFYDVAVELALKLFLKPITRLFSWRGRSISLQECNTSRPA